MYKERERERERDIYIQYIHTYICNTIYTHIYIYRERERYNLLRNSYKGQKTKQEKHPKCHFTNRVACIGAALRHSTAPHSTQGEATSTKHPETSTGTLTPTLGSSPRTQTSQTTQGKDYSHENTSQTRS